jgi:predicted porin
MTFGVNGADRGTAKFIEGGAKYALSKRTTLNVMFGTYDMNAVAAGTATATAVGAGAIDAIKGGNQSRFGLVHTF